MTNYTVYVVFTNGNSFDIAIGCGWSEAIDEARQTLGADQGAEFSGLYIVQENTRKIHAVSMGLDLFHIGEHRIISDY